MARNDEYLRVSEAAALLRVTPQTIRRYCREGKIVGYKTPGNQTVYSNREIRTLLKGGDDIPEETCKRTAHYIRSSNGNKKLLETQREQLQLKYGEPDYFVQDKASGLNEKRKGLAKLVALAQSGSIDEIIITQKDRLTRFGYSYLEQLFEAYGVSVTVAFEADDKSLQEELMQDFMSLIASFSGKFYRLRGYKQQHMLLEDASRRIDDREKGTAQRPAQP